MWETTLGVDPGFCFLGEGPRPNAQIHTCGVFKWISDHHLQVQNKDFGRSIGAGPKTRSGGSWYGGLFTLHTSPPEHLRFSFYTFCEQPHVENGNLGVKGQSAH